MTDHVGKIHCCFVFGKSRLAPLKTLSIPRLELTSATIAVKVNSLLHRELDMTIASTHYWTDSKTVLRYLNNKQTRFHTFVANRITTILGGSEVVEWNYISTGLNPADDASRGLNPRQLNKIIRWLNGLGFLCEHESVWPKEVIDKTISKDDVEVKGEAVVTMISTDDPVFRMVERYSSWSKLVKAVAWIMRFAKYIADKRNNLRTSRSTLTADELKQAEDAVIGFVQRKAYPEIFTVDENLVKKRLPQTIRILNPFLRNRVMRVGGRLSQLPIDYDIWHPKIIPRGHLSSLIIRNCHEDNGHVGPVHTWSLLRKSYWIVSGGAEVRKVIGRCILCIKRKSRQCTQMMADLPKARVTPDKPPFESIGVDYFGPMMVKSGRSTPKRYGCLFTCLASRTVHLELSHDLSITSFINAFRRFTSRRGTPKEIYSDNGTNFVEANKEFATLFRQLQDKQVTAYMNSKQKANKVGI